jgi:site-specific DNA recombinase
MTPTPPTKLIAIYGRVSTARQEEDGTIETQLSAVRQEARERGYTIVREYIDDGWSGDNLERPGLDALRQDAKGKTWEAVLIYDPDRLARRYSYQELVMDELREAGIELMFVTIATPKNSEEKILHGVRGLFAEYERAKIAERFRLGKLRKINEGHILVSQPLYGYNYIPKQGDRHGYYEINPEEARVVRMIFGWVADEGFTIRQVVRRLQDLGIRPRKSKRGVWNPSTLTTLLRNRAYIGEAHWRSTIAVVPQKPISREKYRRMKKSSRKPRPREEWLTVPVPPILDKALFDKARERIEAHAVLSRRNRKYQYLLSGRIRCVCGQKRSGAARQRGKYLYYDCTDKILSFPLPRTCQEKPINARVADELVWQRIKGLMSSRECLTKQARRWVNARQGKTRDAASDLSELERRIKELRRQEDRYNRAYGAGLYTMEQLKEYVLPIRDQIAALDLHIAKAKTGAQGVEIAALPDDRAIEAYAEKARAALRDLSFEQKRSIVLNAVESITAAQKRLEVRGYIPISTDHGAFELEDRYRRDAADKGIPFSFTISVSSASCSIISGIPRI